MGYPDETRERARELHARGLSIREIARELAGPSRMAVWRWIAGAHDGPGARVRPTERRRRVDLPEVVGDGPIYPDIDPEDKDAIIDRLLLENAILRGTQEVLKGRALGCSTNREKSELIEWLRAETGRRLSELTASLRISKSSYEHWHHKVLHPVPTRRELVADEVVLRPMRNGPTPPIFTFHSHQRTCATWTNVLWPLLATPPSSSRSAGP